MGSPYMRLRTLDGHIHAPHDGATPLAVSSPPFPQPHPSSPATPLTSAWALRQGGGPAAAPAAAGGAGFGVVGCGMIAGFHAKAIEQLEGATLVACYDAVAAAAESYGEANGCAVYTDLEKMLADPAVTVVTICTPSGAHMEPAVAAAQHGKHVIVEKPLEVTLARCDAIIDAAAANNVTLATILPERFHESSTALKQAVDDGRFGTLSLGGSYVKWYRDQAYYDSGAWRGTWAMDGGGALMNQAIHSVDMLTWVMGPVAEVAGATTATLAHERVEVEDAVVATLRFANGALGAVEASTAAFPGAMKRLEICGSTGSAVVEEQTVSAWSFAEEVSVSCPSHCRRPAQQRPCSRRGRRTSSCARSWRPRRTSSAAAPTPPTWTPRPTSASSPTCSAPSTAARRPWWTARRAVARSS